MATVYVTEPGAVIGKTSRRLVVRKSGHKLLEVPAFRVDRVLVFGNVQVTTQALVFLLERGIDLSFLSGRGRLRGRLTATESKNVFLRLAQYDRYKDAAFRLRMSKRFLEAKLASQRTLLHRYRRNHPEVDFTEPIRVVERALRELSEADRIESIMGIEGAASGAYFRAFGRMVRREFEFHGRQRRPPRDPVNALLSFGYVLVTNELGALLEASGLDPFIGFLHGIRYGRQSLALDLMEEFRHPLVDGLVLRLVNLAVLGRDDFHTENGAVRMTQSGLRKFFAHYEKRMARPLGRRGAGRDRVLRDVLRRQVRRLERSVLRGEDYVPFRPR